MHIAYQRCSKNDSLDITDAGAKVKALVNEHLIDLGIIQRSHRLNHTEAFWNEVHKVMPSYRERREWLRKNGASMDV